MRKPDLEILDAEFRVIPTSALDTWKLQLPRTQDRVGYILVAVASIIVVAGVVSGHLTGGFITSLLMVGVAAMLTDHHRPIGMVSLGLAVILAATGCSDERTPLSGAQAEQSQAAAQASIREATKYHDLRAEFRPKPIVVGGTTEPAKEKAHDRR